MSQAVRQKTPSAAPRFTFGISRRLIEALTILAAALAVVLFVALATFHPGDPGWSNSGSVEAVQNRCGVVGAWIADFLLYLFGRAAYAFPLALLYMTLHSGVHSVVAALAAPAQWGARLGGFVLAVGALCALLWTHHDPYATEYLHTSGGILGDVIGQAATGALGPTGAGLMLIATFLVGVTLSTGLSWLKVMDTVGGATLTFASHAAVWLGIAREALARFRARRVRVAQVKVEVERRKKREPVRIAPPAPKVEQSERPARERQAVLFRDRDNPQLPALALLDAPRAQSPGFSDEALEAMSRQVELKLKDFGVDVEVVAVHPGPVVTRFEIQPAPGIKASRITNLSKDLARSLSIVSVRVVEVIPGKSVMGLEIPNQNRQLVTLNEILSSTQYDASHSPLTLALGKDISGLPSVIDLAKMPHLLVAGTTGSGKSVALNAMILSLLYKATPKEVRLIMIDPKMLELSVYEGIPALLAPVVTDMSEASNALRWCVAEMERRYRLMAALGVRNIAGMNRKVSEAREAGTPLTDPLFVPVEEGDEAPPLEPLPYIVVIVDELADMMMTTGKKCEELIARLAQKARAAGIHLILATQRPSVDVITGLIKANIPSRIAFQVSSRVDSRTILDQMGAENLLGHGDMLYLPGGTAVPTRVHGAFVSDDEVHKVVEELKAGGEPDYLDEILECADENEMLEAPDGGGGESDAESDPLYDQAVKIVTESRRASISGVQRRLKIGYNRAARLIEAMEFAGIVTAAQSNGQREVIAPPPPGGAD